MAWMVVTWCAMLLVSVDGLPQLARALSRAKDVAKNPPHASALDEVRTASLTSPPTTAYEAGHKGLQFEIREDNRCFVIEIDRPGDHVVATFAFTSNLTGNERRLRGRNLTVEWYGPTGQSSSVFQFDPVHRCAATKCLVRGTSTASDATSDRHGVASGGYSLCFRKSRGSLFDQAFSMLMRNAARSEEMMVVELLGIISGPSSVDGNAPRTTQKSSDALLKNENLKSLHNKLVSIERDINDIHKQSLMFSNRQEEFESTTNRLFTNIWLCGVGTISVMGVVIWLEQKFLRQFIIKKKLV